MMSRLTMWVVLSAVLLAGCKSGQSNSVVGSWTTDDATQKGASIDYKSDGTMVVSNPPDELKRVTEVDANYKIDGDKMTVHLSGMKMTPAAGADEQAKQTAERFNKDMTATAARTPDDVSTLAWKDKDSFTLTSREGKVTTFKRRV